MPTPVMSAADPVRLRLRQLLADKGISQPKLCTLLSTATGRPWLVQRMGKILNGHIELRVEDLVLICQVAGLSLVEVVRDPSREFVADLTPSEVRLINAMRDYPSISQPLIDIVRRLTPETRRPSRAVLRERMRRAKDEG